METETLPWLFAILTGVWFGFMAARAGRSRALWAVGGAAFGLVASALVIGLGRAGSIPFSDNEAAMDRVRWIVEAAALIFVIGWLLTAGLHRHHLLRRQSSAATPVLPREADPKSPPPQPSKGPARPT